MTSTPIFFCNFDSQIIYKDKAEDMLTLVLLYNILYFRTSPFRHGSNNTHNFCGNYSA